MSALCFTSLRTLSPHRKAVLPSMSHSVVIPHSDPQKCYCDMHESKFSSRPAFSTTCHCKTSEPDPSCTHSSGTPSQRLSVGRLKGRGAQQQSLGKVLQEVHLSSWAKGALSNAFNGLGSFAVNVPSRLAEEFGRLTGKLDRFRKPADNKQVQVVFPEAEDLKSQQSSGAKATNLQTKIGETDREQHTFEKAVEDINQGISSYFHGFASPHNVSVKNDVDPKTSTEQEGSWIKKIPLPFMYTPSPQKKKALIRKDFVSRSSVEARTRALVASLKTALSSSSKISRTQDLCRHLKQYPNSRHEATESKAVPVLLRMTLSGDDALKKEALEALALLGYVGPVRGRGICILSLDGGGTRGLISIQCMKQIEKLSNCKIYELFDYVCGVSTGALIAAMVFLYRIPLEDCQRLYLEFSNQMFSRSRVVGTGGLVWKHAFYDSEQWERILQSELGHKKMIEFSRDTVVPKMSAISTLINMPRMKQYVFRTYNLPPNTYSQYPGSCSEELWEVIRASSAAPGYYEDFCLGDYVHCDGGLSTNNPTALAVHESRLLWPNETIKCVISFGTGRYEPVVEIGGASKLSLKEKVSKIVDSATDTEGVHFMMTDLMPPATYFRFNPYLSDDIQLDEIRKDRLDTLMHDTTLYLRKNERKMLKAIETLKQKRHIYQKTLDWMKVRMDSVF